MKKIIFHIGFPRTGTTYLQSKIFPKLKKINFIGKPFNNENSNTFFEFEKKIFNYDDLYFNKRKIFLSSNIKLLFKKEINLISHEGILRNTRFFEKKDKFYKGNNYSNNIKRIYEVLRTNVTKKNIFFLIFLRKQIDLLPSYYSNFWESEYQITRKIDYREFINNCFDHNKYNFGKIIFYNELYDYLTSFMPSLNVKLIKFESFFSKENRDIKLFSSLFNNKEIYVRKLIDDINLNSNKKNQFYYYKNLDKFFPKILKKKFTQTSKLQKSIFNFYKNDNLKLDKKVKNLDLKTKGYY